MSKKEDEELDIFEERINNLQDIMQQLTTHRNHLMYTMQNIENILGAFVEKSTPSNEYGKVNVNPDDISMLADAWFQGLDAIGICFDDIGNFMDTQRTIITYILSKYVKIGKAKKEG